MQQGNEVAQRPVSGRLTRAAAAVAIAIGMLMSAAATAHAAPQIDLTQVCKEQYKQPTAKVKRLPDHNDPYSFYCYLEQRTRSVGIPSGVTAEITEVPLGDLDVQAFCNRHYGGAPATGWGSSNPYWTCGSNAGGGTGGNGW